MQNVNMPYLYKTETRMAFEILEKPLVPAKRAAGNYPVSHS